MPKKNHEKQKNREPQNCWGFWNCPEDMKKECTAYRSNMGRQCWLVCNMSKKNQTIRRNLECTNCEWHKKINNLT